MLVSRRTLAQLMVLHQRCSIRPVRMQPVLGSTRSPLGIPGFCALACARRPEGDRTENEDPMSVMEQSRKVAEDALYQNEAGRKKAERERQKAAEEQAGAWDGGGRHARIPKRVVPLEYQAGQGCFGMAWSVRRGMPGSE
ncbi:unnamed protein product, partial [Symbiodinium sp. CCMP2456]